MDEEARGPHQDAQEALVYSVRVNSGDGSLVLDCCNHFYFCEIQNLTPFLHALAIALCTAHKHTRARARAPHTHSHTCTCTCVCVCTSITVRSRTFTLCNESHTHPVRTPIQFYFQNETDIDPRGYPKRPHRLPFIHTIRSDASTSIHPRYSFFDNPLIIVNHSLILKCYISGRNFPPLHSHFLFVGVVALRVETCVIRFASD